MATTTTTTKFSPIFASAWFFSLFLVFVVAAMFGARGEEDFSSLTSSFSSSFAASKEEKEALFMPRLELRGGGGGGAEIGQFRGRSDGTLETNESLLVRARLTNGGGYERKVYLKFALGTKEDEREEKFHKMRDDGEYPDETANDGVYAVTVDVEKELGAKNGDVVLFRAEAWKEGIDEPLRSPKEDAKKDDPEVTVVKQSQYPYYAVVIVRPSLKSETNLPVLHVLRANEQDMTTDRGTTAKVFFRGKFYDNVKIRRRGSGRDEVNVGVELPPKDWPKHKFKFDFKGRQFVWSKKEPAVEEFNLNSQWQEPGEETYMRLNLANAIMDVAKVPAPTTFHVVLQVNGEYYGLFSFVEQMDKTFLKRRKMWDEENSLYKAVNWKYSNLRAPNASLSKCPWATPDWPRRWSERDGYCPKIWRKAYPENSKAVDDLWDFTSNIARAKKYALGRSQQVYAEKVLFQILDVPSVINEMAAQTILLNNDRCAKNYYVFRNAKTKRWSRLPWDLEDALPADNRYGLALCPKRDCSPKSTRYCVLTCEKFNSPLYCDSEHPQDIFYSEGIAQEAKSTYNELVNVILKTNRTRVMYFARLRTLMNDILGTNFIERYVAKMLKKIRKDALRDSVKWKVGGIRSIDQGVLQLLSQSVKLRREQLFETYSDMIPKTVTEREILENVNVKAFSNMHENASIGLHSWIEIENNSPVAVDISGYSIACSNNVIVWTFTPGTVLDANHSIFVVADESNFLDDIRSTADKNTKNDYYFFVQHGNDKFVRLLEKSLKRNEKSASNGLPGQKKAFFTIEPRKVDRAFKTLSSSSKLSIDSSNCTEPEAGPWEEWGECCRGNKCGVYCDEPSASRGRRRELNFDKFIEELLREEEEEKEEETDTSKLPPRQLCYPSLTANQQVDKKCGALKCGERRLPYTCSTALQYAKRITSSDLVLFGTRKSESGWDSSFSWGVRERNNIAIGIDGREDDKGNTGSVKMQLYGEGAFALGKKFKEGKVFLETFSRFNYLNIFVARERYPQPLPKLTLQIEFYFWRDGGVFSNNDANAIFSTDARFGDFMNDDGWQSGCYEKAFASFKNDFFRRVGGIEDIQRESLSDFLRNKKHLFESADTVTVKVAVRNKSRKAPLVLYVGSVAFVV
jgi:hypothetical protein